MANSNCKKKEVLIKRKTQFPNITGYTAIHGMERHIASGRKFPNTQCYYYFCPGISSIPGQRQRAKAF